MPNTGSKLIRSEVTFIDFPDKPSKTPMKEIGNLLCIVPLWILLMGIGGLAMVRMSTISVYKTTLWHTKSKTAKQAYYRHRLRKYLAKELKNLRDGSSKLYKVRHKEAVRVGTKDLYMVRYEPSKEEYYSISTPENVNCHATYREIPKGSDEWRAYIHIVMDRYRKKFTRRYSGFYSI